MRIESFKEKMKDQGSSWCHPVVYTENDQCCLISQAPGKVVEHTIIPQRMNGGMSLRENLNGD